MSATRRIVLGVSAVWFVRAVSLASGLLLLPILWRVWPQEELGTWIIIGGSQGFLSLLNFGVPPTLMRHIALAKGRSGADPDVALTPESQRRIADLVATGRPILRGIAVLTFLVALPLGLAFLHAIDFQKVSVFRVVAAWGVICAGYAVNVWVSFWECWMAGVGYIGRANIVIATVTVLTLTANIAAVLLGGGLVALAAIFVAAGFVQRIAFRVMLRRADPEMAKVSGHWNGEYARNLVRPSIHTWLYYAGYFLAMQGGVYFIMGMRGADDVPSYNAAYSLLTNLQILAGSFAVASTVFLSQAWQANDRDAVRRHCIRFAQMGSVIMAAGVGFLLTAGREFIELWLGPNSFVGYAVLTVMSLAYTLQIHSVILTTCARATEDERYSASAIAAGILNVLLCWLLIDRYGVLGVAVSLLVAEVATNGWFCLYRPLQRLEISPRNYAWRVGALWLVTLGSTMAVNYLIVDRMHAAGIGRVVIVVSAAIATAIVFGSAIWFGIFDSHHRQRLLARAGRWLGREPASSA